MKCQEYIQLSSHSHTCYCCMENLSKLFQFFSSIFFHRIIVTNNVTSVLSNHVIAVWLSSFFDSSCSLHLFALPLFREGGSFFLFWFMLLLFNYFGIVNFLVLTMLQVYLLIMLLQFGCCQFFLLYHSLGRVGLSLWVYFIVV